MVLLTGASQKAVDWRKPGCYNVVVSRLIAPMDQSTYVENGFANREEYLDSLRDEYGKDVVNALSELLGPDEDFDGLVTMLQDAEDDLC